MFMITNPLLCSHSQVEQHTVDGVAGVDGAVVTVITVQEPEPTPEPGPVAILLHLVTGVLVLDHPLRQEVVTVNVVSN